MSYIEDIKSLGHPTSLSELLSISRKYVPLLYKDAPWTIPGLDRGKALLSSEDLLNCYLAAYGEMHHKKLNAIISKFPFTSLNDDIEIMDWGCGQGIASCAFIDALRQYGLVDKLRKSTLIEPSKTAIDRAALNVSSAVPGLAIEVINKYLPATQDIDNAIESIHVEYPICVHLFSNILDVAEIDLKKLSSLLSKTGYKHYFVCVGPAYAGNARMEAFARYFQQTDSFCDIRNPQFGKIANGKIFGCWAKGYSVVREKGKPILVPISYYPSVQLHAAYRCDAIAQFANKDIYDENWWKVHSSFEVLAPFDFGASVYDNPNPVLAVLSNIVARGLPTKCSPMVEETLSNVFKASEKRIKYGGISYPVSDTKAVNRHEDLLIQIPLGIARVQKTVIEALLANKLDIADQSWDILVKECDVPCSALALSELADMFNHLCALSKDFDVLKFPKINLTIISPKHCKSSLHLGNTVYERVTQADREREYDLVIDIAVNELSCPKDVEFSEFKAKNDCYFNIRSSRTAYTEREVFTTDLIDYKALTTLNQRGEHEIIGEICEHLKYFLQLLFRKKDFRPGQLPILNRAMQNRGVIGLLPTGGGKSLTYQLAAMLQPGVTVVIDPLKSLMEDQYDGLISAGIDCCTYINSELPPEKKMQHESMMELSQVLIVFMSPERLCIFEFRQRLKNMHDVGVYFAYGVIDEVHCVSEWGQDFRFSYLHLGRNLYNYVLPKKEGGHISLFGLTATASFDVLADVERELTGNGKFPIDPDAVVRYENSNRLELQYKIERVPIDFQPDYKLSFTLDPGLPYPVKVGKTINDKERKGDFLKRYITRIPAYVRELQTDEAIHNIMSRFQERESLSEMPSGALRIDFEDDYFQHSKEYNSAGIIFCPHVGANSKSGISVIGNGASLSTICEVGTFYGGNDDGAFTNESMSNMKRFRDNKLPIMVATKAFGMGIDKPNVRYTINVNYSNSLENFVQEAGRAGRDRKMALSVILMSDYDLVRIKQDCTCYEYPVQMLKRKWFRREDLKNILEHYGVTSFVESDLDVCNPLTDLVQIACPNKTEDGKPLWWQCHSCPDVLKRDCDMQHLPEDFRWDYIHLSDLERYVRQNRLHIPKDNYRYQSPDFNVVMYFFDNNFKGERYEKKQMVDILHKSPVSFQIMRKDGTIGLTQNGFGIINAINPLNIEERAIVYLEYTKMTFADVAKAIYRMCIIGLIDDFTQEYRANGAGRFRIVSQKRKPGGYYLKLREYLLRYFAEDRADFEVERASVRKVGAAWPEVYRCLSYLTEFIYDKIALKRRRAIDDMRNFCMIGINGRENWRDTNEELKDEIYFYFNSKFARHGYTTDNDEPFSLLDDTGEGKVSSFDILYKYMRVVDDDVIGVSGSPMDSLKHLQGAVRLIRRGVTDNNGALSLLGVFSFIGLHLNKNAAQRTRLEEFFRDGYLAFKNACPNPIDFYSGIEKYFECFNIKDRNLATQEDMRYLRSLQLRIELEEHGDWLTDFANNYTKQ